MVILCTSGQAVFKAGTHVSTAFTEAQYNQAIEEAEGFIACNTRYNWSGAYGTLSAESRLLLREAASNHAAMYLINFDLSTYPSLATAETQLDVLTFNRDKAIALLKTKEVEDFIVGG